MIPNETNCTDATIYSDKPLKEFRLTDTIMEPHLYSFRNHTASWA